MVVRVAIAAVMKNEGPYILEWLAWHRMIGVERFIIADNESNDGMSEILSALDAQGIVTRIPLPNRPKIPPQIDAYDRIARDHGKDADWLFFIDADEFLRPESGIDGLHPFLDRIPETVGAVGVNWAVYGSSERFQPGPGLVTRRFANRAEQDFSVNRHYKTLIRGRALAGMTDNVHHLRLGMGWKRVNTAFAPLVNFNGHEGLSETVVWDGLRIQHYVIKSWTEFWKKKVSRGRAAGASQQRNGNFFRAHDRNEVYDPLPPELHDRLLAEVETLRAMLGGLAPKVRNLDLAIAEEKLNPDTHMRPRGNIDAATLNAEGDLVARGWALTAAGLHVEEPAIRIGDQTFQPKSLRRIARPDVQNAHPDAVVTCGLELVLAANCLPRMDKPGSSLQICDTLGSDTFGRPRPFVTPS